MRCGPKIPLFRPKHFCIVLVVHYGSFSIIRHYLQDEEVRKIGVRVMTELVEPFREVEIDDEEFACLKAIVFFDPNVPGLTKSEEVRKVRKQVQV